MSSMQSLNNSSITKKCGEILITIKNNAKNVYSFKCWFCDTIYMQMKKFALHLEQEHITKLECTTDFNKVNTIDDTYDNLLCTNDANIDNDPVLVTEIKIEDFSPDDLKNATLQGNQSIEIYQKKNYSADPLETVDSKPKESLQPTPEESKEIEELKAKNLRFIYEQFDNDVEMCIFSDEEHADEFISDCSDNENTSDSDYKLENGSIAQNMDKELNLDPQNCNDKDFILALINAYYRRPQLWNSPHSERCNFKQKELLLEAITNDLNSKYQSELKVYTVKKKLNAICMQYEKEIEKQLNQEGSIFESRLWFYENMSFLKPTIECKLKRKRKKSNHKVNPLNDNLISDLIEIYKNYNSLWDVNHLAYTVKEKRQETMEFMLVEIKNQMNLVLDAYKLEKNLHYIHKTFAKDKRMKLECETKKMEFQPSCPYYRKCEFLESNQGPFKCTDCCKIIETYNEYQMHRSQHDGSIPFKCQRCGMGFKKIYNYTIHAKRHLRVFKFYCKICGKGYPFNAELDLHMRSHTGAQPYLCSVCGEGFRTAISYDNHIRRHEERFKYFCHICKKGFNHMTRLNDHVKAHLNVRDVICLVCGKGFTSRKYLNHHKRIHEGKNYSCNICGKSFAQDAGLRAHKKYHGTPIGVSSIRK